MNTFTENNIREIYQKYVKKDKAYFNKYKILPACPIKMWNYSWNTHDIPRDFAILDFIEWTKKYKIDNVNTLGVTAKCDPELEFINYNNIIELPYPPYDLHILHNEYVNKFDFFIFNQTIEHLYNPFMCMFNIYKYVKPNGYVYTSVPTINIPHMTPIHYTGYNPMGLAMLFLSVGFEVIEIGQWGNSDYISKIFNNHNWPDNTQVRHDNEERNVAQCWILAKKIV